jgi:hypothetical protein
MAGKAAQILEGGNSVGAVLRRHSRFHNSTDARPRRPVLSAMDEESVQFEMSEGARFDRRSGL